MRILLLAILFIKCQAELLHITQPTTCTGDGYGYFAAHGGGATGDIYSTEGGDIRYNIISQPAYYITVSNEDYFEEGTLICGSGEIPTTFDYAAIVVDGYSDYITFDEASNDFVACGYRFVAADRIFMKATPPEDRCLIMYVTDTFEYNILDDYQGDIVLPEHFKGIVAFYDNPSKDEVAP